MVIVRDLNEFDKCNQYLENRRRERLSKPSSDVVTATSMSEKKAENSVALHEKTTLDPQSLFNLRQRARIVSVKNPIFDRY